MRSRDVERSRAVAVLKRTASLLAALFFLLFCAAFNESVSFRALLPAYAVGARGEGEMRLHFLSVGQADCTVVEFPDGSTLVVDAGDGSWESDNRIERYLDGLGVEKIGSLVVTHGDSDHCGGAARLLGRYGAERVYVPMFEGSTGKYRDFLAAAEELGCPMLPLTRYGTIGDPSAYAVCISPRSSEEGSENDCSAVLFLSYAGVNALLCADITAARERLLVEENSLMEGIFDRGEYRVRLGETDILKIAHHGSGESSCEEFLSLLTPSVAVVSCGAGNSYGHPASGALGRLAGAGCSVYRTDELGDVMVTISKDGTYRVDYGYV